MTRRPPRRLPRKEDAAERLIQYAQIQQRAEERKLAMVIGFGMVVLGVVVVAFVPGAVNMGWGVAAGGGAVLGVSPFIVGKALPTQEKDAD